MKKDVSLHESQIKYFTLDEANQLLPYLSHQIDKISEIKQEIEESIYQFEQTGRKFEELYQDNVEDEDVNAVRLNLQQLGDEITDLLHDIQQRGPLVKDIEMGLVDFYCRMGSKTVFLCWKKDEPEIKYWHEIEEGYGGRKNLWEKDLLKCVTNLH